MSESRNPLSVPPPTGGGATNGMTGSSTDMASGPDSRAGDAPDYGPAPTPVHEAYNQAKATYKQVLKSSSLLDHIRREMDDLVQMGDTVSPDDVIGAAGRLVGHGVGAQDMAGLLADMPTMAGQGLAAWLQMHDTNVRQQEAEVDRVKGIVQHKMGVLAVRSMAMDDISERGRKMASGMGQLGPATNGAG